MVEENAALNDLDLNKSAANWNIKNGSHSSVFEGIKNNGKNHEDINFWGPLGSEYASKAFYYRRNVDEFLSNPSAGQFEVLSVSLTRLYRAYLWKHQLQKIKKLAKLNMRAIIKLLELEAYENATRAMLIAFNETSPTRVCSLDQILMADFTCYNDHYLFALKILAFQILIKSKSYHEHQETILSVFAKDTRYLLQTGKIKIHSIVKLLLTFYSLFSAYKTLFGLKFLQYVRQFDLDFSIFIKNMTLQQFQNQVRTSAKRSVSRIEDYLSIFYADYSRFFTTADKLMLHDFTDMMNSNCSSVVSDVMNSLSAMRWHKTESRNSALLSLSEQSTLVALIKARMNDRACDVPKTAALLLNFMHFANDEISSGPRELRRLIDEITLFLNTHLPLISLHVLKELMASMSEFCLNNAESKRLLNIANVAFNAFVVHNVDVFLFEAARLDMLGQTVVDHRDLDLSKLERFISSASSESRVQLLGEFFNVFTLFRYETLSQISRVVGQFSRCFKGLQSTFLQNTNGVSELMLCLLSPVQFPDLGATCHWSPLTRMLYESQRDYMKSNNIKQVVTDDLDPLKLYGPLIETAYALGLEIKCETSLQLSKITDIFIDKWVKRTELTDASLSTLELSLTRMLFGVLRFNKFYSKMISLANSMQSQSSLYYKSYETYTQRQLVTAQIGLRLNAQAEGSLRKLQSLEIPTNLSKMNSSEVIEFADIQLLLAEKDLKIEEFNTLFTHELPKHRPEILDTANSTGMPTKTYVKFLLLNIKILCTSSSLKLTNGNIQDALVDSKRSLKLCQTLLKKLTHVDQEAKWEILTNLGKSFTKIIEIYTRVGIAKDCEFYVTEYLKIAYSIKSPIVIFDCLHVGIEYYRLTEQNNLADALLKKASETFKQLDSGENLEAFLIHLFDKNDKENLVSSLNSIFENETSESQLYNLWTLKVGKTLSKKPNDASQIRANDMNKGKLLYKRISNLMDTDPFFRSMKESVATVPSCVTPPNQSRVVPTRQNELGTPVKRIMSLGVTSSPRPSSLTPRSKPLKHNFDRARTLNDLVTVKRLFESIILEGTKNFELMEIADFYSLSLSLLSSMDASRFISSDLYHHLALRDTPRYLPLIFDRLFSHQGNEIYASFTPKPISSNETFLTDITQRFEQLTLNGSFKSDLPFEVVGIDVCGITGDLLLSKMDFKTDPVCIRLPLGRQSSRDVDETVFNFNDAVRELNDIIRANNKSTTIEITSKIKTKEERKEWWQLRYELDNRMKTMLEKIERSWFGGFKAFFKQVLIEQRQLDSFRAKFEEILQRTLPSRKHFGSPDSFFRIDDAVLGLFLKLDPMENGFMDLMEDLIFFVFDLLLFHGEQNAYDEIDSAFLHTQLEELILEYQQNAEIGSKICHTFLVVCSAGHLIPWESLSFLAGNSISRIPSIQSLTQIFESCQNHPSPTVRLDERVSTILDPHGDLSRTQATFKDVFAQWNTTIPRSRAIVAEKPEESQFIDMVSNSKLFIYMGHGGGEQYVRLKKIKQLSSVAPTFLLGCSSAYMETKGKLEPSGVIYSYLLGGSPMVLGNLWDVTDKDIDKFSNAMFHELGIMGQFNTSTTVSQAVSIARKSCHLRYLNGAAPVVYGLPLRFKW
ncbi:LAME_0H17370g1_1 [Lachancea meyersii CBS 8951]|uniref:separase n=1 Tax=Lachancea meyersii CBS 8951 TaxID=1266667 RepID=A0A1G4KIM5_9SACH|nr:LAME_0H17370g1_1 [Lachancea meyersii CBS 8951]